MTPMLPPKAGDAHDRILDWIRQGRVRAGRRLPPERELARQLGMDQRTIRRGLAALDESGVIEKRPRIGNFVREAPATQIALVLPPWLYEAYHGTHPLLNCYRQGITEVFDQQNATLHTLVYSEPAEFWAGPGQIARARGVSGMILHGHRSMRPEHLQPALDAGMKVVVTPGLHALGHLPIVGIRVSVDAALAEAGRGLIERGHRDIRIVRYTKENELGFGHQEPMLRDLWREHGMSWDAHRYITLPNTGGWIDVRPLDVSRLHAVLDAQPRPTALIVQDEYMAAAVFRYAYHQGVRIPDELSLVSVCDHTPHLHPVELTAPDSHALYIQAGRLAAQYLQRQLAGETPAEHDIAIACPLQWKASAGPPKMAPDGDDAGDPFLLHV